MKKTMVILLALVLAGPSALRADPQDDLKGKVVRISGTVNGLGVVLLYKTGSYIVLEDVDGSKRQAYDLKNRECRVAVLAYSRESYLRRLHDGLIHKETQAVVNPAPAGSAFAYLSDVAENARRSRIGSVIPTFIAGSHISTYAIYALVLTGILGGEGGSYITNAQLALATGLVVNGVGVLHLLGKSSAERRYEQARELSGEECDAFCASALKKESMEAQTRRFCKTGLLFGLATFFVVARPIPVTDETEFFPTMDHDSDYNIHSAIACGLLGLVNLFLRYNQEKAYRRYLKEKAAAEKSNKLTLNVGLVPRGFALGVRYCFQ